MTPPSSSAKSPAPRATKTPPTALPAAEPKKRRHPLLRVLDALVVTINVLAALGLCASAYAGTVDPRSCPAAVIVAMAFPAPLLAVVVLFIMDLLWWRRTAFIPGIAMLLCAGAIGDFCPLNYPRRQPKADQKALRVLTYNCMAFLVQPQDHSPVNPQISYILADDPDVVCIQEYFLMKRDERTRVKQSQVDSLDARYPYQAVCSYFQKVYSKYPIEPVPLDFKNTEGGAGDMAAWRLHVDSRVINLFTVHLRSLYFTGEDRKRYRDMLHPDRINRSTLSELRSDILRKITLASRERAAQVDDLQRYIARYGGETVIVCGDFNEPNGGYALHALERDSHLRQVYPEVGFGPMVTYNANRFYVRIDHMLYRGQLRPVRMRRGDTRGSDHYPLTTTFLLTD